MKKSYFFTLLTLISISSTYSMENGDNVRLVQIKIFDPYRQNTKLLDLFTDDNSNDSIEYDDHKNYIAAVCLQSRNGEKPKRFFWNKWTETPVYNNEIWIGIACLVGAPQGTSIPISQVPFHSYKIPANEHYLILQPTITDGIPSLEKITEARIRQADAFMNLDNATQAQ